MLPIVKKHVDSHEVVASMIIEQTMEPVKPKILHVEKSPGVNFVRFYACLQDFDVFNRNNRKYLLQPMIESWNSPHIQELIHYGDLFGENGHPITQDPIRVVTIDPKLCCHRIVGVEFKGKSLYGTIETLNDEQWGKQFMMHILQGCWAAFSLRALAPLTKIDATRCEIRSKCHVVTEDRVILPSHKKAYQQGTPGEIISESAIGGVDIVAATNKILESYGNKSEENVNINFAVSESAGMDMVRYLLEESHNIKDIVDHFEIQYEGAWLSPDHKSVILKEKADSTGGKRTFVVSMENYVQSEVSEMLRKW
jgi:hypothetical protein